jgi:hypothetical protein
MGGARTKELGETHTSDEQVQGKTIFKKLETNGWGIGLALGYLTHPQIQPSRSFASDLYGYVPASFSFADDKFVVHANVGTLRAEEERHHRLAWGLGSEIRINPRIYLVPEVFSQTERGPHLQVGTRYWVVPNRVQIDFTIGDRIGHSNGDRWFSIGLRLLSSPFLP